LNFFLKRLDRVHPVSIINLGTIFVHRDHSSRDALEQALSFGNGWAKKALYLVAVGANPEKDCLTNGLPHYAYNAGLSVMCLVIEAEHQGLRVRQITDYNEAKVKTVLGFPPKYRVIVVFALGYKSNVKSIWDELEERIKDKLLKSRERKPIKQNFFFQKVNPK
jgi:hypothetical protein